MASKVAEFLDDAGSGEVGVALEHGLDALLVGIELRAYRRTEPILKPPQL